MRVWSPIAQSSPNTTFGPIETCLPILAERWFACSYHCDEAAIDSRRESLVIVTLALGAGHEFLILNKETEHEQNNENQHTFF